MVWEGNVVVGKMRKAVVSLGMVDMGCVLYVAVSASHVILSCDCGKFLVVYSSIDHINAT